ncbi:hypothetical protein A2U01_0094533, partial [Trifolium medium]|nr:hypothetical protein [Trifolium medium]
ARLTLQFKNAKEERDNGLYSQILAYELECSKKSHRIEMKLRRGQVHPPKYTRGKSAKLKSEP